MGEVLNNGVYLPDRGERNAYDGLKGNWNTLDSIAGKVPGYDGHISDTDIHVTAADKQTWNGKADASHVHNANDVTTGVFDAARIPNLDASKITTGTIDIDRLPQGALERLVKVADQSARYALTAADVQLGDTVQQLDTGVMYVVTDETKLDSADGYTEFTAGAASSVPWTGVTGKPNDYPPSSHTHTKSQITDFPALATVATSGEYSDLNNIPASFTPSSHTHGNITNDGKLDTASRALVTDANKNIAVSSVTATELGYVSGVTSAIQTQIAGKAPAVHTHTKADITDLFNSANTWTDNNYFPLTLYQKGFSPRASAPASNEFGQFSIVDTSNSAIMSINYANRTTGARDLSLRVFDGTGTVNGVGVFKDAINNYSFCCIDPNNTISLGNSAIQWKSVYAQSYYYNGTAWGLDKANVWSNYNYFSPYRVQIKSASQEIGVLPSSSQWNGFQFTDKNNNQTVSFEHAFLPAETRFKIQLVDNIKSNESGTTVYDEMMRMILYSGRKAVVFDGNLRSFVNGVYNLGDSNQKWKTLNGVNPGALGIPSGVRQSISEYITDVNLGWVNQITAVRDGYIVVTITDAAGNSIYLFNNTKQYSNGCCGNGSQGTGRLTCMLPVNEGDVINIFIKAAALSDVFSAYLYVMNGNVNALPSS